MALTEGETRALLASTALVLLALIGRTLLQPAAPVVRAVGLEPAGSVDSALAVAESSYAEGRRRRTPLGRDERIDPNLAGETELDRLPGIGPALARAVVRDREARGPFRTLRDLERVPGLGSKTVKRLAPHLVLSRMGAGGGSRGLNPRRQPESRKGRQERLDLNTVRLEELEALPGIGPARARAIVRWRDEHGGIGNLADLLAVPGIGPATLKRLRPWVLVRP